MYHKCIVEIILWITVTSRSLLDIVRDHVKPIQLNKLNSQEKRKTIFQLNRKLFTN